VEDSLTSCNTVKSQRNDSVKIPPLTPHAAAADDVIAPKAKAGDTPDLNFKYVLHWKDFENDDKNRVTRSALLIDVSGSKDEAG